MIFDRSASQATNQAEKDAIDGGIRDWNNVKESACTDVTHESATLIGRQWNGKAGPTPDVPPDDTIYVVRTMDRNGQFDASYHVTLGVRRAWLYMRSDFNETTSDHHSRVDNLAKHEAGHGFGVRNAEGTSSTVSPSTMGQDLGPPPGYNYNITTCDIAGIRAVYCPVSPTPSPTPNPPSGCSNWMYNTFEGGVCPLGFTADGTTGFYCCEDCVYQTSEQVWDPSGYGELDCSVCQDGIDNDCSDGGADDLDYDCDLCFPSPIVIDTLGNGFNLSSAASGVDFDIRGVGRRIRVSWTRDDDAWLALDRNGNGTIDNGKELFGNFTYQFSSPERNGFRALDVYDEVGNGGNEDGLIDIRDAVYQSLRLWLDSNRNGVSEPSELHTLASKNVATLELDYRKSQRTDGNGNRFRYRAKVRSVTGAELGRWAWDVFLVTETQTSSMSNALLKEAFASRINIFGNTSSCQKRSL